MRPVVVALNKIDQPRRLGPADLQALVPMAPRVPISALNGAGLAAPQIGKDIRLFVMDSAQIFNNMDEKEKQEDNYPDAPGIKQVFINAHIVEGQK